MTTTPQAIAAENDIVALTRGMVLATTGELATVIDRHLAPLVAERDALQAEVRHWMNSNAACALLAEKLRAELAAMKAVVEKLNRSRERLSEEMWKHVHNPSFGPSILGNICEAGRNELELRIESIQKVLDLDLVDFPEDDPDSEAARAAAEKGQVKDAN